MEQNNISIFENEEDIYIKSKLQEIYTEKKIMAIYKHKSLNNLIMQREKFYNLSKEDYLNKLGFIFAEDHGKDVNDDTVDYFLEKYYLEKVIPNLTELRIRKQKLYKYIVKYCKDNNLDKIDYLNSKGYKVEGYYHRSVTIKRKAKRKADNQSNSSLLVDHKLISNKYNVKSMIELSENYNCNKSEIGKWIGIKRQQATEIIKNGITTDNFTGEEIYFENEVEETIIDLVKNYEYEYISSALQLKIYFNNNVNSLAIVYSYNNYIKCIFDPVGKVKEALIEYGYYNFKNIDIDLLKKLKCKNYFEYIERWDGDRSKIKITDTHINSIINKNSKAYNLSQEKYVEFLGYKLYTNYDEIEDRLYGIFKNNLTESGIVKINMKLENGKHNYEYIKVNKDLKKLGIKIEDLSQKFGFSYKRIVNRGSLDEKYKDEIKEKYIVKNNYIYINSQDKFYNTISTNAYKQNMDLDKYINSLGFIRIKNKNELPDKYVEYDWRKAICNVKSIEERVNNILNNIAIIDKNIYLDTNSYIYDLLNRYSYILDLSINDMINQLGFERVYKRNLTSDEKERDFENDKMNYEEEYKQDILNKLSSLETSTQKNERTTNSIKRNQQLPKFLKLLYKNKCQLCSEKSIQIPPIKDKYGKEYVEVHHIKCLASGFDESNECDIDIDTYKNAIVVCCYHHKYLHINNGGANKIIKINQKLFLESKNGELIEISTNYHLDIN